MSAIAISTFFRATASTKCDNLETVVVDFVADDLARALSQKEKGLFQRRAVLDAQYQVVHFPFRQGIQATLRGRQARGTLNWGSGA